MDGYFHAVPLGRKTAYWPADRLKPQVPTADLVHVIALEANHSIRRTCGFCDAHFSARWRTSGLYCCTVRVNVAVCVVEPEVAVTVI
jgi:hypothetical protein